MFRQLLRLFWKKRGDQGENTPGQREADPLSNGTGRRKSFWGRIGFGRKASSQNVISQQEERLKELEELKFEIQKCQFERDELYQILDLYIYDDWDHRLDVELPVLQSEHEMRMMAMQMMTNSISDAMERYKELIQVNSSYRIRHSQLLREQTQLENNIQILLNEKKEQLVEQTELPASSEEIKRFCEEAGMNICDPRAKQQQGPEVILPARCPPSWRPALRRRQVANKKRKKKRKEKAEEETREGDLSGFGGQLRLGQARYDSGGVSNRDCSLAVSREEAQASPARGPRGLALARTPSRTSVWSPGTASSKQGGLHRQSSRIKV
eukprot:XP_017452184.1 PREDICTED: uncharacterized protein LOC691414 isoform X4 [Rattus norvegicus]